MTHGVLFLDMVHAMLSREEAMKEQDAFECIRLRQAYVAAARGRSLHWVICCRRPGGPWELWGGSETKEDAERIREGLLERRPALEAFDWSLVGPESA